LPTLQLSLYIATAFNPASRLQGVVVQPLLLLLLLAYLRFTYCPEGMVVLLTSSLRDHVMN